MSVHFNFLRRKIAYRLRSWLKTIKSLKNTPKDANVLLVTFRHELPETQLYAFHFYRHILEKKHGIKFVQIFVDNLVLPNADILHGTDKFPNIKRIFFQPAFEMSSELVVQALKRLSNTYPNAKIAFMDWYAPLHIRPSVYVDPYIDIYIKKQTYVDFSQYSVPTLGDTNLSNFYAIRHNLPEAEQVFVPPINFEKKIQLGNNFGLSPQMVDLFMSNPPKIDGRDIDVHARIAVNGVPWYKAMRQEAKDAVENIANKSITIASEGRVKRRKFFVEMQRSKICFSPFGYGEICWRDYEAFATGALLLKPDMSHLRVLPDIFVPYETYVPLKWDLSDFDEKVQHYLLDAVAREKIANQAFLAMQRWIKSDDCSKKILDMCK
ncbi:hypothetical protein J2X19_001554 [Rhodoferax ferrireducens]|uniref:Uncharacterized protein n=1 Tax=Rhodoferax ferrireducens TaxID=192843 RepID=A0ABU2C6D7_9BURK|nr:glycosyltransferase [Rhodoferax ferrireducens]MDR7376896.1 hypothetical protein [Rhodoferax ferrireducens]